MKRLILYSPWSGRLVGERVRLPICANAEGEGEGEVRAKVRGTLYAFDRICYRALKAHGEE